MKITLQCLFSPRLYKIYNDGPRESFYNANIMEKVGDKAIRVAQIMYSTVLYTSPMIMLYLYKHGMYTYEDAKFAGKLICSISCVLAVAILMRGVSRSYNTKYVEFLNTFNATSTDVKPYIQSVRKYDFDFASWPESYKVPRQKRQGWKMWKYNSGANEDLSPFNRGVLQVVAYLCTHTFALRLIYPGTLTFIEIMLNDALHVGRTQLVEDYGGQRAKVVTADGNAIDTMLVDKRGESSHGSILVICCEGNTGFYEIGIMSTAFRSNYSALGWNHPGFAASTGKPYPSQEQNAIDAVVMYAVNELGFNVNDIVFFGWSIGGYSATWAASHYPECRGLVLDATFDDLLPLALRQMPKCWSRLVREIIRTHVNLDIAALLNTYPGPVVLVRRTRDEIICVTQGDISTNRGNNLVLSLIESRHPEVASEHGPLLRKYVSLLGPQRDNLIRDNPGNYHTVKLIRQYMQDYSSTHCAALPESDFIQAMKTVDPKRA